MAGRRSGNTCERACAALGALDVIGAVNGEPASRYTIAHLDLQCLRERVRERESREALRSIARFLRRWHADEPKVRAALALVSPVCVGTSARKRDDPRERAAFTDRIAALLSLLAEAIAAVPPTARPEWDPDEIDASPTRKRIDGAAVRIALALGWDPSGAALRDLLVSQNVISERESGSRERLGVQALRERRRAGVRRRRPASRG